MEKRWYWKLAAQLDVSNYRQVSLAFCLHKSRSIDYADIQLVLTKAALGVLFLRP